MTNASAMTLCLMLFLALLGAAVYIIISGGGLFTRRDRPKAKLKQHAKPEQFRRAA